MMKMKEINGALSSVQAGMEVLWSHVPYTVKSYMTMTYLQQFGSPFLYAHPFAAATLLKMQLHPPLPASAFRFM